MKLTWHDVLKFALLALAAALLMRGFDARAQDLGKPMVLVASPSMQGFYNHAVVIAVPSGDVHVGFILNRASGVRLAALFPEHLPSAKVADSVYVGGPEMADAIFALVRRDPGGESLHFFGDVFVVRGAETVDRVIEETPNDARYFAGFVGWEPGELAQELQAGSWYVTEPDSSLVSRDTGNLWEELVTRLGNGHVPPRGQLSASLEGEGR